MSKAIATVSPGISAALEVQPCWGQIGVFGDGSCPELRTHTHCHNCPVHSAAGLQLLNRALPEGYRRERTEDFARQRGPRDHANISALVFRVDAEWLAFPTRLLQEVTEPKKIHSLPHRRGGAVLGLANIRGELMVCVSLSRLLGFPSRSTGSANVPAAHRLLVLQLPDATRIACPVDEVHGPQRFQPSELKRLPLKAQSAPLSCSQSMVHWRDQAVAILDPDLVFSTFQRNLR